jgi:hypothetical protein
MSPRLRLLEACHYSYRVTWLEERGGEHLARCDEFPSLAVIGPRPEKALSHLMGLVQGVLDEMEKTGESPPLPHHPERA